ncbi:MAG TPA: thioredoxin domain-containing protein [Nitrosopumilaceae archaeon]|nr:thioredoxin domain-containing protein [Nitrosopumilaceae archaeon]
MKNRYYLTIPVILGVISGLFLYGIEDEEVLFSRENLMKNGSPLVGNPSAPITIVEWGDYQCTYCYRFHQSSLNVILNEYVETGKVNLVFKDFPLNGPDSILAAEAAYCAGDQGKYWEYHNELYTNWGGERTGWINYDSLNKFAVTVNLSIDDFSSCLSGHKYKEKVLDLEKFGKEIGIDATPSFLVFNDKKIIKIRGNQPLDVFRKAIDEL